MSESKTRVGGSGWTVFTWRGQRLAWLQQISDTGPSPVTSPQAIQPLDAEYPLEIVTPRALGVGTMKLTIIELWNTPHWQQLAGMEGTQNILDVFKRQVTLGSVSCQKIIKVPNGPLRVKNYYGCVITDIDDSESINIGTLSMPKGLTIQYTHSRLV